MKRMITPNRTMYLMREFMDKNIPTTHAYQRHALKSSRCKTARFSRCMTKTRELWCLSDGAGIHGGDENDAGSPARRQ